VVPGGQARRSRKGSGETGHNLIWSAGRVTASFFYFRRHSRCAPGSTAGAAPSGCGGGPSVTDDQPSRAAADSTTHLTGSRIQPDEERFDIRRNIRPLGRHGGKLN
jgi:hypothetical protein